jgi:pimeloyl-ACP methyl ester carboxylesterase
MIQQLIFIALTVGIPDDAKPQSVKPPTGLWMGTLNIMMIQKLRLVVEVTSPTPGKLMATMDIIDQGAMGIPMDVFVADGSKMKWEIKALGASFEGELKPDGKYHGTFKQGPLNTALVLERIEKRPLSPGRPQDPKKPYPYVEEETSVINNAVNPPLKLAGTLTMPKGDGPFPAVVLITGSGAQNRNEELMNHRPFLVLADHLTRKGIAVLRMDDRGVGGSKGGSANDTSKDFAGDILAAAEHLRTDKRIDPKKVGLIGHSEGGIIAPMVAAENPDTVAFIVLLAGPTLTGKEILFLQGEKILMAGGMSASDAKENRAVQERLFEVMEKELDAKKRAERLDEELKASVRKVSGALKKSFESETSRKMQAAALNNGWMKFFLTYDPLPALTKVKCPTLAVWGEKDLQVPPVENVATLKKAIPDYEKRNMTLTVMPGLNHLFQTAGTGSPAEYQALTETFSPNALTEVSTWILKQTGKKD